MTRKSNEAGIPKKMGRPEKPISWDQFEQLCALQCTQSEIANMFHVDVDTICNRVKKNYLAPYSDIYKRFSESGKCSLRRNQFVISKKNATMAIWLGKIWLGQKDPALDESKEDMLHALKSAVKEIQSQSGIDVAERSFVEDKQSLSHQGCAGKENGIQTELGAENSMGGSA